MLRVEFDQYSDQEIDELLEHHKADARAAKKLRTMSIYLEDKIKFRKLENDINKNITKIERYIYNKEIGLDYFGNER